MYIERLEELSVYFFIKDLFTDVDSITFTDEYPEFDLTLPTVAVESDEIILTNYELGNREPIRTRRWYIYTFAKTKSQRDDIAYRIINSFQDGVKVYNYDEGFPPDVAPSVIEHLRWESLGYTPVKVMADLPENLYFRGTISIVLTNDTV